MKKNITKAWIYCVCLTGFLSQVCVLYGDSQKPLTEYTTENGLTVNSVNDLLFDKSGFLWITTPDGLQRFDGYHFRTFRHDSSNKKSLPENFLYDLYEDKNGNLWISHLGGLSFKARGRFEFICLTSYFPSHTNNITISCVGENDSCVWMMDYAAGIYSINKSSLHVQKVCDLPAQFEKDGATALSHVQSANDRAWVRKKTDPGGDLFLVTTSGFTQFKNTQHTQVLLLIPADKDSMFVVTDNSLYKTTIGKPFKMTRTLQENFTTGTLDNKYKTWPRKRIGTNQWLLSGTKKNLLYDGVAHKLDSIPANNFFSSDVNRYLNVTVTDRHGNNWLGYDAVGGIKVITTSRQKFSLFDRPENNALPYCLATDNKGNVYVGIFRGDIEVYNSEGKFLEKINLPVEHKNLGSARAMMMIDSTTLIVKSTFSELYAVNIRTRHVEVISNLLPHIDSTFAGFSSDFEPDIQKVGEAVWVSWQNMIISIQKDIYSKIGFSCTKICAIPVKERISTFYRQSNGKLWIGTITGCWNFFNNGFQKFPLTAYIKQITPKQDGTIWIASSNGIYIVLNGKIIKQLNIKDGLPNSFIYGLLFDDDRNAWISTNRGLAKIDTAWKISAYSVKEGLQGDEFNTRGYCKGTGGTLYFAGVNGINFFKPKNFVSNRASPTMLTGIEVNNQPFQPTLQPEFINKINLSHQQNNIRLSFANMDFTEPEKNQFRFFLKGFQNEWSLPQTNNTVQYILPPGEYELYVLSANYEGLWSNEPLVLHINISPPWYQKLWAKIFFILLGIAIAGSVFYFISRNRYLKKVRQLQMEQQVQKEKQRLSRDLHDNLGSQLTWLSNNITQLENAQQQQKPVEQKMTMLKESAGELMKTLRETIWILNKDKISCIDIFDKVVGLAARHIEVCPPMQLNTEEKIIDNLELSSGKALQLFHICQEAINNACKHAGASLLTISAQTEKNIFTITIQDNGKGFETGAAASEGHYGLQNMKQRAEESDLNLNIDSTPGTGTILTASVHS